MTDVVKLFKGQLKLLPSFKRRLKDLKDQRDILFYNLTGLKGVSYDHQPTSYNKELSEQKKLELLDKLESVDKEIENTKYNIDYVESKLNKMNKRVADAMIKIYCYDMTYDDVANADDSCWSSTGLFYQIEQEIKKAYQ